MVHFLKQAAQVVHRLLEVVASSVHEVIEVLVDAGQLMISGNDFLVSRAQLGILVVELLPHLRQFGQGVAQLAVHAL